MPAGTTLPLPRAERAEAPAARCGPPQVQPEPPIERPSEPGKAPPPPRRRWLRHALFSLAPLALIAGTYWYATGGQVMCTGDAYAEAEKVGISTDVSGIVKDIGLRNNQRAGAGQVPYRLDGQPYRFALLRAEAQVGMVRDALTALKANYRNTQVQIIQAQDNIDYYARDFSVGAASSAAPLLKRDCVSC